MWEHPYHCTVIQDGRHLLNCLRYVDLNMVRARVVGHPRDWAWCGYDELIGQRKRYRILNLDHLRQRLGWRSVSELQQWYAEAIDQQVARQLLSREPHWTESLAVGEQDFVERVARNYRARTRFEYTHSPDGLCCVREARVPYSTGEAP
jgi:putative transposase